MTEAKSAEVKLLKFGVPAFTPTEQKPTKAINTNIVNAKRVL